MEGKCRSEDIIYKCVVTATGHPQNVYLGTAAGNSKQRYYNHKKLFANRKYPNEISLSKYIWEMKDKHNISPNLMWCIVKSVPGYSNISKRYMLCVHEKYEILNYPDQEELGEHIGDIFSVKAITYNIKSLYIQYIYNTIFL